MNPLAQSKKTTILSLLISLSLVISGCASLHIARSQLSPVVLPEVATGRFRFNVVVKNGGTTNSPTAFLEVQAGYRPTQKPFPYPTAQCWMGTPKYFKIPQLKPGETRAYSSRIEDLGETPISGGAPDIGYEPDTPPPSWCGTCKKGECNGWIYFRLYKATYFPLYPSPEAVIGVGAQITGPNTLLEISWDAVGVNEVTDYSH